MATPNYAIDPNDKRLTDVKKAEAADIKADGATYDNMIKDSQTYYDDAIKKYGVMDKNGNWNEGSMAQIQTDLANKNTEFAIEKIEQQKAQTEKEYLKEQSAAYTDWQKQSDQYGVNAEKAASAGLNNSGYSESSQVSMYNTYQNRVAIARESFDRAVMNFNNQMTEARLQNSSVLAEIAYETLAKTSELAIAGFQYKNTLVLEKANSQFERKKFWSAEHQRVLDQINTENALVEEVRQHNEDQKLKKEQLTFDKDMATKEYNLEVDKHNLDVQKFNAENADGGRVGGSSSIEKNPSGSSSGSESSSSSINKQGPPTKEQAQASKESAPKYDMSSLAKLGYAGKSAAEINKLVQEGYIEEYEENGVIKFKRSGKALVNKLKNLFK